MVGDSASEYHHQSFVNDQSLQNRIWDWTKLSIAEVLDRGGGVCAAAVERERKRAYPVIPTRDTADLDTKVETTST